MTTRFLAMLSLSCLILLSMTPAVPAALGERVSSIATDAARMDASAGANTAAPLPGLPTELAPRSGKYTIEQFTTPAATVVSEYVNGDGVVFAVTWRGPKPPDLVTLLGSYFKQYSDAVDASGHPFGPHASAVHARDVTVETAGHMGFMWGRAYLASAMPAGVGPSEVR